MRAVRPNLLRTALAGVSRSAIRPLAISRHSVVLPSAVSLFPQLSLRSYSAQAKLKAEEEDEFFSNTEIEPPAPSSTASTSREPTSATASAPASSFAAEDAADEFFDSAISSSPSSSRTSDASKPTTSSSASRTGPSVQLVPFDSLKGRVNHDTLKALTFKPFQLLAMSEVQRRVLGHMPELAGGKTQKQLVQEETDDEARAREQRVEAGRKDLLVKAKTGTGKTIAFLVPAIEARINTIERLAREPVDGRTPTPSQVGQLERNLYRSHVGALIISPTRELATQIANEALKLCTWHKQMQVRLMVGGNARYQQLKDFKRGRLDFVVATPGRLKDLLSEPEVAEAVAKTDMLILDEADTLLEMGFSKDLQAILEHLPSPEQRQTFLFSATVSPEIRRIAAASLKRNHEVIDCVPKNESNVHTHIPQYATVLGSAAEQIPHVLRLIAHDQLVNPASKIVVFLPTTKQTMLFATLLRELKQSLPAGLSVHEIHSRLGQDARSRAAARFRRDERPAVLVTSDVSARGVDYPGVTRVIQVGIPSNGEQYIHRVGRTGRGGSTDGRGDLVLLPFEAGFLGELSKIPIKNLDAADLKTEIETLDAGYAARAQGEQGIDEAVAQLMPSLDADAVSDVFMSLLGFYIGKTAELNAPATRVIDGLKDWSVQAAGLERPPFISASMMQKLGIAKSMRGGGGGRFGRNDRGGAAGRPRFGTRDDDRPRFGARDDDRPRFGARDDDRPQRPKFGFAGRDKDGGDGFAPRERKPWGERSERGDRTERADRGDRGDRADWGERSDRGERSERAGFGGRSEFGGFGGSGGARPRPRFGRGERD